MLHKSKIKKTEKTKVGENVVEKVNENVVEKVNENVVENVMENVVELIKKKKGRPRKTPVIDVDVDVVELVEKKKRGRKKKEKGDEVIKPKKKRGRKVAVKYYSSETRKVLNGFSVPINIPNKNQSILHLDIKDEIEIKNKEPYEILTEDCYAKYNELNDDLYDCIENDNNVEDLYEKRLLARSVPIEYPTLKPEIKINCDKSSKSSKSDKDENYYKVLGNYFENTWVEKINVCCWWCCHTFDNIPIGLPVDYNIKTNRFRLKGVFCSFGCMLAYNDPISVKYKSLINFLYRRLTGNDCSGLQHTYNCEFIEDKNIRDNYIKAISSYIEQPLKKAPLRCTLEMFGGNLSINEFRNCIKESKIYTMIDYPMFISRDYIKEVDINKVKIANAMVFTDVKITKDIKRDNQKIEAAKIRVKAEKVKMKEVKQFGIDQFINS
jgi:hypothetical protein